MKRLRKEEKEDEEEEEGDHEKRMKECREFCQKYLYDLPMTAEEYENLECSTEKYEENRLRQRIKAMAEREVEAVIKSLEKEEVVEEEKERFRVVVEGTGSEIRYMIDNYVHVTKFVNSLTGEPYNFNLVALAICLLNYYVEYSCKKFAKVNKRHFKGPSHLFYKSSVVVETGSDNHALSRRLLEEMLTILREECNFPHINIEHRSCQNIVATGYFSDNICLNVLQQRFQETRRDEEEETFKGVIVKQRSLKPYMSDINECSHSEEEELAEGDKIIEEGYVATAHYKDDGDDSELLRRINLPILYKPKQEERPKKRPRLWEGKEEGEEEEEEEEEDEDDPLMVEMRETDEYYTHGLGGKRKNCTTLVFRKSHIICTGCRTDMELHRSIIPLCKLLHECRESNPANRKLEKELTRRAGKRVKSK